MPFVRYARDRRGYDTVYVMHAFEGPEKSPRVRVLYAARTVPHAKVGRTTLDETVQRRIEQAYPSLRFEWPRLLKEAAASAPRPERTDSRAPEPRGRQRRERKPARARNQENQVPQVPQVPSVPEVRFEVPQVPQVQEVQELQLEPVEAEEIIEAREPLDPITELVEWTSVVEPIDAIEPIEPEVLDFIGPLVVDRAWPVVAVAGADRALILRGRYIELAHRVLSRVSGPAERARLLREAARLNPESWKTEEQARAGLAGFEEAYSRLAEQLRQPPPV